MACNTPMHQRSATPEKDKILTVTNEFLRRFRNNSRDLPMSSLEKVVKDYVQDLRRGGFSNSWIQNTLNSAATGYARQIAREITGTAPINRPASYGKKKRLVKRLIGKATWFQAKNQEKLTHTNTRPHKAQNKAKTHTTAPKGAQWRAPHDVGQTARVQTN